MEAPDAPGGANGGQSTGSVHTRPSEDDARRRTFERSFAGPSVGKAGLVRDQTGMCKTVTGAISHTDSSEINKVIAESSKGSKYYNRQVQRNEDHNRKVEWFQAKRDELMKMARLDHLESEAQRILLEVEASRDLSQVIVHVDMDAFYASVEMKRDPSLKGKAFGVGGGVLTTASYEARKFGVRSGMAEFVARKLCPHIIVVKNNFELYTEASRSVREVLLQYDENLQMASLDEGYLKYESSRALILNTECNSITPYSKLHDMTAEDVVSQLRAEVEAKTDLTISAGIAPNKMLAKICSDKNKPNGQFALSFDRGDITRFMRDLPVRRIPGYGRVAERFLEGMGVEVGTRTCGDIYTKRHELLVMDHWFGFRGLCRAYLGIADNHVAPGKREDRKSVGVERTFRDKSNDQDILDTLADIAVELGKDMERLQYAGKTVNVKYKLHTYEVKTRAQTVKKMISKTEDILPIANELLKKELPLKIRLLGIRMSTLTDLTQKSADITKFFGAPGKKRTRSPSVRASISDMAGDGTTPEVVDLLDSDDEDFDRSPVIDSPAERSETGGGPESLRPPEGPACPICGEHLRPEASNQELNDHVDLCLNRDAIGDAAGPSPRKKPRRDSREASKKGKDPPKKGSMLAWLKKA